MLLGILSMALNPASPPNQSMFTVNRISNDEVDVTASMTNGDAGPYVYVFPLPDYKQAPSIELEPASAGVERSPWYMSSLTQLAVGVAKTPAAGSATETARLYIRRPR